jgi:RNA polymerase sigma factor (sigma-70 family)
MTPLPPASPDLEIDPELLVLADGVAADFIQRSGSVADQAALRSAARLGLWKALRQHDPTKGPFKPYAYRRIVGEVIDEIRSASIMTRHFRDRWQALERKKQALEQALGRELSPEEFSVEAHLSPKEIAYAQPVTHVEDFAWDTDLVDPTTPLDQILSRELSEKVLACILQLKEYHQAALLQRYFLDEPLQDRADSYFH